MANELLDVYGPLLTKHQQEILDYYYAEDFSYAEISEELDIRSGSCHGYGPSGNKAVGEI